MKQIGESLSLSCVLPMTQTVADRIERQAMMQPQALAVREPAAALTYAELNALSAQWAQKLRRHGCGSNQLVALLLERSVDFIVAALAVLRAGGAYLPLDPTWPGTRLRMVLQESGAPLLLARKQWAAELTGGEWEVHAWEDGPGVAETALPPIAPSPHDLAYVIYTSGSTGQPKGVEITQRNLVNLIDWHCDEFAIGPADRASVQASVGFDASVWEIWPNLCAGASLHLPDEVTRSSPERLRDWLLANQITMCFVASPMAERLLDLPWPETAALRTLLTGAETLHRGPSLPLPFDLVNNYGPTECTVVTTSGLVPPGMGKEFPGIGRPIAGACVYVLDDRRQPVAAGEAGEMYIGGECVARGYRHRPDLTAERFLPDPWRPGASMYRTGDRVRVRSDGTLAFLGRIDDQIKLRGYRIEPQEVMAALDRHAGVRRSVVTAAATDLNELQLVAYVQLHPNAYPGPGELREFLRGLLPEYMIPTAFVAVEEFPLNRSGKIDLRALPAPDPLYRMKDGEFAACRTPLERDVAAILAALLRLGQIGAQDNFFLLGGHSLLGTQLIVRVRERFGVELPLRTLFDHPTVAELAAEIDRRRSSAVQVKAA